ncbi:hypothetical protein PR048_029938 [Dryococelus australis]|uniref:Uncharacterized protein n=1 Tax=Dryococelus australis TaxID=614101 RepID=A0ABQ9GAB6_9NEOP|nr:hypothetical protein PR048_029938 [Dryococelus australis]
MMAYNGKILYKACIRPVMINAAPAWGYAANMHIRKIQIALNKAIRRITHVPRYVRITPNHRELGLETIRDCMVKQAQAFYQTTADQSNPLIEPWVNTA